VAGKELWRPPLVGREEEIGVLSAGLENAVNGHGGLYLISGTAGMGKTRLAEWSAERAREHGARVLWGRCWETVDTPAYWPWSQLIRQTLEPLADQERDKLVGPHRAAIARMAPEVVDRLDGGSPDPTTRIEEFDALSGFFKRAAEREPIVLLLEDLHAADESSQLMLQYLARETHEDRIFIVATCDGDEIDVKPGQGSFLADIAREGVSISLHGIDEEAIAQLFEILVGHKPTASIVGGLHSSTEGNPLFVTEAIAMLTVTGDLHRPDHSTGFRVPRNVRDMFRRRLSGLSEESHALLTMASVIGREFDTSLLGRVAALEVDTTLGLLDGAVAAGIIQQTGALGRYRFTHVLIRETVYEDLSPANRMRVHRLAAEALEDTAGPDSDERLPELAHHWFKAAQAGDPDKALVYAERAAQAATAKGAHEEAARLYQRALKVAELAAAPDDHIEVLKGALLTARSATGAIYQEVTSTPQDHRFAREGEYWTIVYQGTITRLKDSKGLGFLAQLLGEPGREFHVLDLVNAAQGNPVARDRAGEELRSEGLGDAGEVLDAVAKAAYRDRIAELREAIEEADTFNDPARSERAQEELDALVAQISGAVGLGGRDRKAASVAERARVSVTKTIRDALRKISENDSTLGSHLVSTIKTGIYCSYTPDPRVPVEWQI
jgi:hypothetical protein